MLNQKIAIAKVSKPMNLTASIYQEKILVARKERADWQNAEGLEERNEEVS